MTLQLGYLATDTLGKLVPRTDTLRMVNKSTDNAVWPWLKKPARRKKKSVKTG